MSSSRLVEITADDRGLRLDRALAKALPDLSRTRIKTLLAAGQVTLKGAAVSDPNYRVAPGERFAVAVPPPEPAEDEAQAIPLAIVHEDAQLIVIDKPPSLVVHPAAGNRSGTLVNALLAHCGESLRAVGALGRPGIVHRIDKDTSGLLVAAKTERAHRSLGKQFAAHAIERVYTALVWGAPRANAGVIDAPLARAATDRKKIAVMTSGRVARTHYEVIERFSARGRTIASLVRLKLETGRTHQIRVHMAHIGHPLVGDQTYGQGRRAPEGRDPAETRAFEALNAFPRQALHAGVLGFQHPATHKNLRFESPLPGDFTELLEAVSHLSQ